MPYALNDAKIFATYCQKTLGLPQKNIKTYTDATFGVLLSAVDNIKKIAEAYKGNLNVCEKVAQESIVTNGKSQTPTVVSSSALGDGWKNMRLK